MNRPRFLRGPAAAHAGQEVLYILAGLPVGVLGLAYVLVALGVGAALAVVFVGLPLIASPGGSAPCTGRWPGGCSAWTWKPHGYGHIAVSVTGYASD
jgi:hypothetical protein